MKKKHRILVFLLLAIFTIAGCSQKTEIQYDREAVTNACEQFIGIVGGGNFSSDDINSLSEWNQGYLMSQLESQSAIQMDASVLISAIDGWNAAIEECGVYVEHGDYRFRETTTGLTVETTAQYVDRTADLVFAFNKDLKLTSFTISAHYDTSEILKKAGLNTVLGMGTVFAMLIFMSFVIFLLRFVPGIVNAVCAPFRKIRSHFHHKKNKKNAAPDEHYVPLKPQDSAEEETRDLENVAENAEEHENLADDLELVAVIAAAIAAYEGTDLDEFIVRKVNRRRSNKWNH